MIFPQKRKTNNMTIAKLLSIPNVKAFWDVKTPSSVTNAGGRVSRWTSLKGGYYGDNTANFSQQPKWDSTNHKITYDNIAQVLLLDNNFNAIAMNVGRLVIIIAVKYSTANQNMQSVYIQTGTSGARAFIGQADYGSGTRKLSVGGRRLDSDSASFADYSGTSTNKILQTGILDYSNAKAYQKLNGILVATKNPFQTSGNTSNTYSAVCGLGGTYTNGQNLLGDIYGICIGYMTDAEIQKIEKFMCSRYGIAYGGTP